MELLLTNLEIRALKDVLESEISHLGLEVAATKDLRVRENLVTEKELLLSILEKLPSAVLDVA